MARSPGCDGTVARGGYRLTCTPIRSQAAPCRTCGVYPEPLLHVVEGPEGLALYRAADCPVCAQPGGETNSES